MRIVGVEPDEAKAVLPDGYWQACRLAERAQFDDARRLYVEVQDAASATDMRLRALIRNDLAAMAALEGRFDEARQGWQEAIEVDPGCPLARLNDALVKAEMDRLVLRQGDVPAPLEFAPAPGPSVPSVFDARHSSPVTRDFVRVAILSFLFNWPSTGGGNMHTAGLTQFLGRAGYEVRHIFARFPDWGIGRVADELLSPADVIEFDASAWNVGEIQARYRRAVEQFDPDYVVITDAWNMKPLLAEAVRGYPYFLLIQAQENLCPLNNLRLLATGPEQVEQCPRNQLATPVVCHRCLAERGHHSGALHQVERALAGVGTPEYDQKLRQSLQEAEAVLALNPLTAAMLEPFSSRVRIVPWGIDPARFPWPLHDGAGSGESASSERPSSGPAGHLPPRGEGNQDPSSGPAGHLPPPGGKEKTTLFMAAVANELIKGYHVANEACRILHQTRNDFELVVTFDPPGPGRIDEFTRSVGWCSQAELPRHYRAADICLVPTIAQDGLSITSVEAMASGIPVVASRIGGVPYTVADGLTGLLFEPADPADLARQIARLLDDPDLRRRMGLAGRKRFEEEFTWEIVIDRYWRPLLSPRAASAGVTPVRKLIKNGVAAVIGANPMAPEGTTPATVRGELRSNQKGGRETIAVNIVSGLADRLKPGLQPRIPAAFVGVPPSGGLGIGSTDRLKPGLQPEDPPVSLGIAALQDVHRTDPDTCDQEKCCRTRDRRENDPERRNRRTNLGRPMFDVAPFLQPDDPWLATEDPELVRRLYAEKYQVAEMLRPRSIVEIGVRAGYSAAAFLSAAPACTFLGLDADQPVYGGWPGALDKARVVLHEQFGDRVELTSLDTQRMTSLSCGPVDLVHVDGDHSYNGCLHDLRLAAEIGRWVLVDDLDWEIPVRAAVTAFLEETRYRAIELPTVRGDMLIEVRPREKTFSHGGDTGDLIYALPTVKMLGGGRLRLVKAQQVREPFSPAKVESLRPLLEAQPYVSSVEYGEEATGLNLDAFRKLYRDDLNLSDLVSTTFGVPHYPREVPWLFCSDPRPVARVVINRSARYHGNRFPWHRVQEKYGREAVFVGLPEEHAAWQSAFGPVHYCPTPDWWELCRVIAGSQVFCGNQSAPMAIALGLCVPRIVQEVCHYTPNCHFERRGVEYGRDENVELPD